MRMIATIMGGILAGSLLVGCGASTLPTATGQPTASECTRDQPAETPIRGGAELGGYRDNLLPASFKVYKTEAQVNEAIRNIYNRRTDWACFQKFYPGAVRKFRENTGLG